jgi:dTDP-4-amino-4,6-dideoxygalactose transaminase
LWKVPFFDVYFSEDEQSNVSDVIQRGWISQGEQVQQFEEEFAQLIGVEYAIAVSSGTAALHLANRVLGLTQGDEVLCPSLTFVAGPNSIMYTGATPVFVDVQSDDDFSISVADIERKIGPKTKAIQVMHYGGNACAMDEIVNLAKRRGLYVIEDCAHAIDVDFHNLKCGAWGDVGCFSFFANKNMTTAEGGMLTTHSAEMAEKLRLLRSHCMTALSLDKHKGHAYSYDVLDMGYNYRMDEIRAALGLVQLRKLHEIKAKRSLVADVYREALSAETLLTIPYSQRENTASAHHLFPILLDSSIDRDRFILNMRDKGVQLSIHYPPVHEFSFYRDRFCNEVNLPVVDLIKGRVVTLPIYPGMSAETAMFVCDCIKDILSKLSANE